MTPWSFLEKWMDWCPNFNPIMNSLLWFQAAQKLENGKMLARCPRCSLPSQIDVVSNVGQCTHERCQYLFCCICHCESHNGNTCPFSMSFSPSRKRLGSVGSKASKKNLRRLWLLLCHWDLHNSLAQIHNLQHTFPVAVLMLCHTTVDCFVLNYFIFHWWWLYHMPIGAVYKAWSAEGCHSTWNVQFLLRMQYLLQAYRCERYLEFYAYHLKDGTYDIFINN